MKRKKYKILLTGATLLIISLMTGCNIIDYDIDDYSQFTPDELSHLYFDKDSLVMDGDNIDYFDTIAFLHNSKDTLLKVVYTNIYSYIYPFASYNHCIYGSSRMNFNEKTGFRYAQVQLRKEYSNDAVKTLDFPMLIGGCSDVKMNIPLDTALVLGITYNNVYKFDYPENSPSKLKYIYFAKKFGFIKVETADGRRLERLDLSNEDIRLLLSK